MVCTSRTEEGAEACSSKTSGGRGSIAVVDLGLVG